MDFSLYDSTILLCRGGSRAYGIHREDSDLDLQGVLVAPKRYQIGLRVYEQANAINQFNTAEFKALFNEDDLDIIARTKCEGTVFEVKKWLSLAKDCNPNILECVFCRDEDVLLIRPMGQLLRDNRDIFISKAAYERYVGYARGQMERAERHRRWITSAPTHLPTREEFGLKPVDKVFQAKMGEIDAAVKRIVDGWELNLTGLEPSIRIEIMNHVNESLSEQMILKDEKYLLAANRLGLDDNLIETLKQERAFARAKDDYRSYQKWLKERNPARAELEKKFGIDLKHVSHMVRLIKTCEDLLDNGELHIWRGGRDADLIKSIREGAWAYPEIQEWFKSKMVELKEKSIKSSLPAHPNFEAVDNLCMEIIEYSMNKENGKT